MSPRSSTVLLCRRTSSSSRNWVQTASSVSFISSSVSPPYTTRLSTYGDRAFPVAAARVWNSLPQHVTSALTLSTFRIHVKTHYYNFFVIYSTFCSCLRSDFVIMDTLIVFTYLLTSRRWGNMWRFVVLLCTVHRWTVLLWYDRRSCLPLCTSK